MDGHQTFGPVKNRSDQKTLNIRSALQRKEDTDKKEILEKQTQDAQVRSLFFSILKFKKNKFFLRARLLKMLRDLLRSRRRKNRLKMIQQLHKINDTLDALKKHQKKQEQEKEHAISLPAKPITLFKDLMATRKVARSAILEKQRERHHQSKSSKLE